MERALSTPFYEPSEESVPLKQSILVIDDSQDTLALSRIVLELGGFEVFTAESGAEAIAILSKISEPNLILLDMQLGDMTGTEFLALLEKNTPEIIKDVPVVFLTGMDKVPKSKAAGFMRKSADIRQFLKTIRVYVEMGYHAPYKH